MRIGELAGATGVSPRLLRYYEERGLLQPARTENGYREYGPDAPLLVRQARALLAAGLTTDVIRLLLPCARGPEPSLTPCPELLAALRDERRRLDGRIEALSGMRDVLDRYLETAQRAAEGSA